VTRRGSAQRGVGDKCQAFAREVVDPTRMRKRWPCVNVGSCVCTSRNQRIGSHPKGITYADAVAPRETVACLFADRQMKAGDVRLRAQTSETAIFDGCGRNSVERGDRSELERPRREASREVPSEVTPQIDPAVQGRVVKFTVRQVLPHSESLPAQTRACRIVCWQVSIWSRRSDANLLGLITSTCPCHVNKCQHISVNPPARNRTTSESSACGSIT
jgi:hypothetical protein